MSDRSLTARLSDEATHWANVARIAHRVPQHDAGGRVPDVPDELARHIAYGAQILENAAAATADYFRRLLAEHRRADGGRLLNDDGTVR